MISKTNNSHSEKNPVFKSKNSDRLPRILLAGVFGPYGVDDEFGRKENIMELFHNQVTKVQGAASLRFHHRSFGLYFMAENVNADVTILDFPSQKHFIRELDQGYDIVGISFITPNFSKAKAMAQITKEKSPDSVILLGGHGAAIENIENLIPCDHVVRGEGVRWLRKFLGEDPEAPIKHPHLPSNDYHRVFGVPMPGITAGLLVPGVGCDNGCRFCSTTHFFGKSYQHFVSSGKELFDIACLMAESEGYNTFFVLDENFLSHREHATGLLKEMLEAKKLFTFHVFASADAVSEFGVENLARLGVHMLWIGVESKTGPVFAKNDGIDHAALIKDLRQHGISVLASSILCMEHHNQENMQEDIDYMISLKADFFQFMLLTGLPVTETYIEHKTKGLLKKDLPFEEWHGQKHLNYEHAEFPGNAPEEWLNRAFQEEYERNSSSILRMMETALMGYRTLSVKGEKDEILKMRAAQLLERIQKYRQLLPTIRQHAVNSLEKQRCKKINQEISTLIGSPNLKQRLMSRVAQLFAICWKIRVKILSDRIQPKTRVTYYRAGSQI